MTDAQIRDWAREQGLDVGDRGALPRSVRSAYTKAHEPAGDYPPGMSDADFDVTPPPEPPQENGQAQDDMGESRPRAVPAPRPRRPWQRKHKTARKKKHPRVPIDDTIAVLWRGLAGFARPLPATSRLLKIQAPVAGIILEDVVRDTVVDRLLQPVARYSERAEAVAVLAGPPILVTAIQVNQMQRIADPSRPDVTPFIMPALRELMLRMCKVAGPKMRQALAQEKEFEEEFGATVDDLIASLFDTVPAAEGQTAEQAEDEAVRRAQEVLQR